MANTYPLWLLRLFSKPPRFFYRIGLGPLLGKRVLLLTTTGRKSGLPRTTPLQYERMGESFYIGSMRGEMADWYQNLVADPRVSLQIGRDKFKGIAEAIDDPDKVFEFLRFRYEKNPRMIGAILALDGLSSPPDNDELRRYARGRTIVAIKPVTSLGTLED